MLDHVQPIRISFRTGIVELRAGQSYGPVFQAARHRFDLDPSNLLAATVDFEEIEAGVALGSPFQSGLERNDKSREDHPTE